MKKIIYIENNCTKPQYNLAFEEYVFTRIAESTPILLLWQNEPSVIIGRYQNSAEEINSDFVRSKGIQVVRRNTGGGAVYHDMGNLNFSFIIPDVESRVDFRTFSIPVVKALRSCGIPAEQTGRNDILVDGKKFSGNAQQFSRHRLLHHGTLMFDVNTDSVADALRVKPGKFQSKSVKSVRSRVTNLKPYFEKVSADAGQPTGACTCTEDFKALLLRWFSKEYELSVMKLTSGQLAEIEKLSLEKYSSDEWNFGRSPKADVIRGARFRCGYIEFSFSVKNNVIQSARINGDFFSSRPLEELETAFAGVTYDRSPVLDVLRRSDLNSYLGDVTAEELADVIV